MDTNARQQPTADKGTHNPDQDVTNDPEARPSYDLTSQPARNKANEQYYQQAFTRHLHCVTSAFRSRVRSQAGSALAAGGEAALTRMLGLYKQDMRTALGLTGAVNAKDVGREVLDGSGS